MSVRGNDGGMIGGEGFITRNQLSAARNSIVRRSARSLAKFLWWVARPVTIDRHSVAD